MMKDYRHMMRQVTLSDQKKEEIMEMLENKQPQKRRIPRAGKLILAAALAVGCVLSIAAGLPAQVYNFIGGGSVTVVPGTNTAYYFRGGADPVEVDESGRVWFTADGQHLDITELVDENTPYIYERTDSATGQKGYLVIGGRHDNLGWMEWYQMNGDWFWNAENCVNNTSAFSAGAAGIGEAAIVVQNLPDELDPVLGDAEPAPSGGEYVTESEYTVGEVAEYVIDFRPWAKAANAQLAEMGIEQYQPQVD